MLLYHSTFGTFVQDVIFTLPMKIVDLEMRLGGVNEGGDQVEVVTSIVTGILVK